MWAFIVYLLTSVWRSATRSVASFYLEQISTSFGLRFKYQGERGKRGQMSMLSWVVFLQAASPGWGQA